MKGSILSPTVANGDIRNLWYNYRSEVVFSLILSALLVVSAWLSQWIPAEVFDRYINPSCSTVTTAICFFGAGLCLRHHDGIRVRRLWAYMLIAWGLWEVLMVVASATTNPEIMQLGTDTMSGVTMVVACVFGWLLFIYPTEVLRPGWLDWKHALLQLAPLVVLGGLDYFVPIDLRWLIGLYPIGLLVILVGHIRRYRIWCEDNFSTLDNIDVQWIVRYVMMVLLSGLVFYWLCLSHQPARAFTQQWFLMFVLAYTTDRVLFRPDPWKKVQEDKQSTKDDSPAASDDEQSYAAYKVTLESWLAQDKPYLNPDFQLSDLRQVLPLNRSYLSRFINSEYGCTFYQWVNHLRIEEAKRLMTGQPDMKIQEVAERSGFSSRRVFTQVFNRETGLNPTAWIASLG